MFVLIARWIILASFLATLSMGCYSGSGLKESLPYKVGISQLTAVKDFISEMKSKHGFDEVSLQRVFDKVQAHKSIIDEMSKPYEQKVWANYRSLYINEKHIELGRKYLSENAAAFNLEKSTYGVAPSVVAAIIGIETEYGAKLGGYRVIDALSTIAFSDKKYSGFYRSELEQFLLLCREQHIDVFEPQGQFSGAMGIPSFMPTTYRRMAVDGDGDGRRDIWKSQSDAILTLSNFLAKNGWRPNEPIASLSGNVNNFKGSSNMLELQGVSGPEYWLLSYNFSVLQRYNKNSMYAMLVAQLSSAIEGGLIESAVARQLVREEAVKKPVDAIMEKAKSDCDQLYKAGTRDYGNCVMELIK